MNTKEIRQILGDGDLKNVLETLRENVTETDQLNRVTSLAFRFSEMNRQRNSGTANQDALKQEQNQIVDALLALINELEKQAAQTAAEPTAIVQKVPILRAYLSVGTPHNELQAHFLDFLRNYFRLKNVVLETVGSTSWSSRKPLIPIKQKLESVSGCVVLATERFCAERRFFPER